MVFLNNKINSYPATIYDYRWVPDSWANMREKWSIKNWPTNGVLYCIGIRMCLLKEMWNCWEMKVGLIKKEQEYPFRIEKILSVISNRNYDWYFIHFTVNGMLNYLMGFYLLCIDCLSYLLRDSDSNCCWF